MNTNVDVMNAAVRLEAAVKKSTEAAEKLLKCAESISNPTYSVVMQGSAGELEILAVRHFAGQIVLTVKSPKDIEAQQRKPLTFTDVDVDPLLPYGGNHV